MDRRFGYHDIIAGISVALVLIPQSLAYAEIAGLPPYVGLFAAALPPIAAAIFASSPYLQTGPVAMTSLLTFGALAQVPGLETGSDEYLKLAALLALLVGVFRLALGAVKGGFVAYLMSQPVVIGFTAAAAILISASQFPRIVGVVAGDGSLLGEAFRALLSPGSWDSGAVALSLLTFGVIIGGRRLHPLFPGVLVAVVVGIVYANVAEYSGLVVGAVPAGLPPLSLALPWSASVGLLVPAIVIALVGFAEPAAIARTYATQDRQPWSPDREFISQGVANLASGLSGGFPVGGSFSRSSINRLAGGRTRWSGAITGLTVFAFLPFASVIERLPTAILGAIVIAGVYKLIRLVSIARIVRYSRLQALVAWATFTLTLVLSPRIDQAVILGIGLGVVVHLWREMRVDIRTWVVEGSIHLQPRGVLYFGSAPALGDRLASEMAEHPQLERVVIELQRLGRIDYTGALALKQAVDDAVAADLTVTLAGVPAHSRTTLGRVWESELPEEDLLGVRPKEE